MKLEYLKIKYAFIEGRNPNKDLENTFVVLFEEFTDWEINYFILKKHKIDDAINKFIDEKLSEVLRDESFILKTLVMHRDSIEQLKKYLKEMSEE